MFHNNNHQGGYGGLLLTLRSALRSALRSTLRNGLKLVTVRCGPTAAIVVDPAETQAFTAPNGGLRRVTAGSRIVQAIERKGGTEGYGGFGGFLQGRTLCARTHPCA
jgi:hypothetical protein